MIKPEHKALFSGIVTVAVAIAGLTGAAAAAPAANKNQTVRTLETITIEGEIDVPQVLFITSRDYPRYRDGLGSTYRKNTLDVARSIVMPARLRIMAISTPLVIKEE